MTSILHFVTKMEDGGLKQDQEGPLPKQILIDFIDVLIECSQH